MPGTVLLKAGGLTSSVNTVYIIGIVIVIETHRLLMLQSYGTRQKISVRKWEKSPISGDFLPQKIMQGHAGIRRETIANLYLMRNIY